MPTKPRHPLLALLILGASALFVPPLAQAQTIPEICLTTPDATCADALNTRLAEIEAAMTNPQDRAMRQMVRAQTLARAGHIDEAEALITSMQPPPEYARLKDEALRLVIQDLGTATQTHGRRLLSMIQAPDAYNAARSYYIVNLAKTASFDQLMAEVQATQRDDAKLEYFALLAMLEKAAAAEQTDAAISLIETHTPDTPEERGPNFRMLAVELAKAGKVAEAERVIETLSDHTWQSIARSEVAGVVAAAGDAAKADVLFGQAREDLLQIADYDPRKWAFDMLAQSAVKAGRMDLAVAAVDDLTNFPIDVANALTTVARVAADNDIPAAEWRVHIDRALELIGDSHPPGPVGDQQNDLMASIATLVAQAGDTDLAKTLIGRIPDDQRQSLEFANFASRLTNDGLFDAALAILPSQKNWDFQAQGLIQLAFAAREEGQTDTADKAYGLVLGLVEGPEFVEVSDYVISLLAWYESSIGAYDTANTRFNFITDLNVQIHGRITTAAFVAEFGSQGQLEEYLAATTQAIAQHPEPRQQESYTLALALELARAGKDDVALALAQRVADPAGRDEILGIYVANLGETRFLQAMAAVQAISSPTAKQLNEHLVLTNALAAAWSVNRQ